MIDEEDAITSKNHGSRRTYRMAAHVWVGAHGSNFEDCYRRLIMVDGVHPKDGWGKLLFDYDDSRFTSTEYKEYLRDKILGLGVRSRIRDGVYRS